MIIQYKADGLTAQQLYKLVNITHFQGKLPDIPIKWVKFRTHLILGRTFINTEDKASFIELNAYFRNHLSIWCSTLIHEMVHVEMGDTPEEEYHGEAFQARMRELAAQGAFDPFW